MPPPIRSTIRDLHRDCTPADMVAALKWLRDNGNTAFGKSKWYAWKAAPFGTVDASHNMIRALAHVRGCRLIVVPRKAAGEGGANG